MRSRIHTMRRGIFVDADGVAQSAPAPRYLGLATTTLRMATRQDEVLWTIA